MSMKLHRACRRGSSRFGRSRCGTALVALIILLVMANLAVIGLVHRSARDQDLTAAEIESARAFHAAESGLSLAIRELQIDTDEDADGGIGSISDDGNAANDPTLNPGAAKFYVTATSAAGQTTLVSTGRCGVTRHKLSAVLD